MQLRVTLMSPFWQEWQPVGIRVGVSKLKFAWSVAISVGQTLHVTGHAAVIWALYVLSVQYFAS